MKEDIKCLFDWLIKNIKRIRADYSAVILSLISLLIAFLKDSSHEEANIINYMIFLATSLGALATVAGVLIAYNTIDAWRKERDWVRSIQVLEKFLEAVLDAKDFFILLKYQFARKDGTLEGTRKIIKFDDAKKLLLKTRSLSLQSEFARKYCPKSDEISTKVKTIEKYSNALTKNIIEMLDESEKFEWENLKKEHSDNLNETITLFKSLKEICVKNIVSR